MGLASSLTQSGLLSSILVVLAAEVGGLSGAFGVMSILLCALLWQAAWLSEQRKRMRREAELKPQELDYRFHQIFDHAPFVVQRYAPDGTHRQTNKVWETVWGCSRDGLVGYNVLQDKQAIALGHLPFLQRAFAGDTVTLPMMFYDPALNGYEGRCRWLEGSAYAIKNQQGEVKEVVLITKDVTDRHQLEATLSQQARLIAVQQEIAQKSLNLNESLALMVDRTQQLTRAEGAAIEIREGDELVYRAASGSGASQVGLRLKLAASLSGRCVETSKLIYCHDTEADPRVDIAACRRMGIRSMAVVPLLQEGSVFGVLKVFSAMTHAFTEQNLQTLQLMAGFLANTLELATAFQAQEKLLLDLQASEERYASVIAAMAEGVTLQDTEGVICASNSSAERILGLSADQMMGRSSLDPRWHTIYEDGSLFPGDQHPAMVTLRTGEPCRNVTMGVAKPDDRLTWISINTQPLFYAGEALPYAVVASFSDITERRQAEAQVKLLQSLALKIGESRDFDAALTEVLQWVCKTGWSYGEAWIPCAESYALQCSPAYYINCEEDTQQLVQLRAFRAVSERFCFPFGVGIPGRVWAAQKPEWQKNVSHQAEECFLRQTIALQSGIKTGFGIPVVVNQQVLAVLIFFKSAAVDEDPRLLNSLVAIATQLGSMLQRRQTEDALQESESRFQTFMNHSPAVAFMKDELGRYVYANQSLERVFNVKLSDLKGKTDFDWLPEEVARQVRENDAIVRATGEPVEVLETVPMSDGNHHYWLVNKFPFQDAAGRTYVGGIAVDITDRQQMEQELFQEKELAQVTLQSIGDAVITTDAAGKIVYFNPVAEALTGWSQPEAQGLPLLEVFNIVNETTREPVQNPIAKALREGRIVGLANHTVLIARDGREIAIEDSAAPIRDRQGEIVGAVMVFHDVTQNRTLSRQLSWQATHDVLTGLVNRAEFERRVEQALSSARSDHQSHALCYLDLDRFKIVNDTCGHAAGDELLRQITALLQEKIRKTDLLARIGGDEFGVLLSQCTLEQALRIANELRETVHTFRFFWEGQSFTIGASIGLVSLDFNSEGLAEIMSAADAACYTAKNRGRNRVYVIQADDQELRQQRGEMQWVSRIAQALENDRFCLYAQPIASITAAAQNGDHYEVLLRLRDEQDNLVPPMAFIPAAERYNLMHLIDRWVIRRLFKDWDKVVNSDRSIYAVNLSGSSINDDEFIDFLHEQFASYPISPRQICFEITETVAISNLAKASQFIQDLQQLGCRFALDDFGAGMSSFAYLKSLPVDYLKIDGVFIRNILENSVDDAIVAAIVHIGTVMGIRTIAEFVENDAILERITTLGVDYAQGYGIAKPSILVAL